MGTGLVLMLGKCSHLRQAKTPTEVEHEGRRKTDLGDAVGEVDDVLPAEGHALREHTAMLGISGASVSEIMPSVLASRRYESQA